MDTPICDFLARYSGGSPLRLHMPGHKGSPLLGFEANDITEIDGADSLFDASGIILQSEENASKLFGSRTFYSTEGSSLCIRAMLYLCVLYAKEQGKLPLIAAARNVHNTFLRAAAMLDFDIQWLYGKRQSGYLSCEIDPLWLDQWISTAEQRPVAVYLTSPDYLGNRADIQAISQVCHKYGILLIVDNAHGAYLRFLPHSEHPIDLGADICCDSAHKTLPVLTGGAYLHISNRAPKLFSDLAKQALAMFGSTSPSYLILQSLDAANRYLQYEYPSRLEIFISHCCLAKERLCKQGYLFIGSEPLKWTIDCKQYGYTGTEMAHILKEQNIFTEFSDPEYLVMMLSPEIGNAGLDRLEEVLHQIPQKTIISDVSPIPLPAKEILTPRQASLTPCEFIPVTESLGRILASPSVGCPPAVPIIVCGEQIDEDAIACFIHYGINTCCVTIP